MNNVVKINIYENGKDSYNIGNESPLDTKISYSLLTNTKSANCISSYKQKNNDYKIVDCLYSTQGTIIVEKKIGSEVKLSYFKNVK